MTSVPVPSDLMRAADGSYLPRGKVKPADLLEDQTVDKIIGFGKELEAQIGRFKGHTFEDISEFLGLINEQYGVTKRGLKGRGNVQLTSFDGSKRVLVQVSDQIAFGPQLQAAKAIIDDLLIRWSEGARDELRSIVSKAFQVDQAGRLNHADIFALLRYGIDDPEWKQAMEAIRESIRVIGSKTYIRLQERDILDDGFGPWRTISIDLASAEVPSHLAADHRLPADRLGGR
ncbi:MAG: DUF3164 family protein [Rhizobiales bacterium]|nr:DUF3164 family protein [Hyphomicrobiales bacterium]